MPDSTAENDNKSTNEKSRPALRSILANDFYAQSPACLSGIPKVTFVNVDANDSAFSSTSAFASAQARNGTSILASPPPLTFVDPSRSTSVPNTNDSTSHKRPLTLLERRSREKNGMNMSSISGLSVETIQDSLCESYNTTIQEPTVPLVRGWSRNVKAFTNDRNYQHLCEALSKKSMKRFQPREGEKTPLVIESTSYKNPDPFQLVRSLKGAFTIVSYNILASRYVTKDRYPHCPLAALAESYRVGLVRLEIQEIMPDIIVFEEMSVEVFENSLGPFLKKSMHYEGDHLVITDRQGIPRCDAGVLTSVNEDKLTAKNDIGDADAGEMGDCALRLSMGGPESVDLAFSSTFSRSQYVCQDKYISAVRDHDKDETKKNILELVDVVSRRTEMEGVAIFYNRNRFKILEKIPVRFNELAAQDPDITKAELKKLQVNTHNVSLVFVIQDLTLPGQIYIVAAVHLLYQHVKFQLWQSHCLLRVMQGLKEKYETCEGAPQHQVDDRVARSASKEQDNTQGVPAPPSSHAPHSTLLKGTSIKRQVSCVIAGDLNLDKNHPVFEYILKSTIPASTPMPQHWYSPGNWAKDTAPSSVKEEPHNVARTPESPQTCCATQADLPDVIDFNSNITTTASSARTLSTQTQRIWNGFKFNAKSLASSISLKSPLTRSLGVLPTKSAPIMIKTTATDILNQKGISISHQNLENDPPALKRRRRRATRRGDRHEVCEEAASLPLSSTYCRSHHRIFHPGTDDSIKDYSWNIAVSTAENLLIPEVVKTPQPKRCQTAPGIDIENTNHCSEDNEFTSPLQQSKQRDIDSAQHMLNDILQEEKDIEMSLPMHPPTTPMSLDSTCSEVAQKGSNMTSVVLSFNPLPLKKLSTTMFGDQASPSWANSPDHREEFDSPLRACHTFDQSISFLSHTPQHFDSPILLDLDSHTHSPHQKTAVPSCKISPRFAHALCFSDAYEVYCAHHPSRVSAVNPSSNMEGKVLDHILYEDEHLACVSVLRLGDNMLLPTRNIPSDHYIVGALLIPKVSLVLAYED